MRKFRFVALALVIISLIWCVFKIIDGIQKREWVITTATIYDIGLPDGAVFGTYKDQQGIVHSQELYCSTFYQVFDKNIEKYNGKKVKIIYNPNTLTDKHKPDIEKYNPYYFSLIALVVSIMFLGLCIKKKKI